MSVRVVFFDLGDTLVEIAPHILEDSARQITLFTGYPVSAAELKEAERAEWLTRTPQDFLWVQTEEQEQEFWEQVFYPSVLQRLGISSSLLRLAPLAQMLAVRVMTPQSFVSFLEVKEILTALKRARIGLGIISNSFPSAERLLCHLKLEGYFDYVVFSHKVGTAKPEPEIYHIALRVANVQPDEVLFVDDRASLAEGAMKVGIYSLLVSRNDHSNGWTGPQISNLRELLTFLSRSELEKDMRFWVLAQRCSAAGACSIASPHNLEMIL